MRRRDLRRAKFAIDPVETGFLGAGMSRETQSLIPAGETQFAGGSMTEDAPPEYKPGFA
jgi:hypothetical protein